MPEPRPRSQSHHWLIVAGGLICFAAMWLPLFDAPFQRGSFVPMNDEYGYVCWLWLVIPWLGFAGRCATVVTRVVLVAGGTVGAFVIVGLAVAFDFLPALAFLPVPLAVLMSGVVGRSAGWLSLLIGAATLVACAFLSSDTPRWGLDVLALGGLVLVIGGAFQTRRDRIGRMNMHDS